MKGGKGGQGRKRSTQKVSDKPKPQAGMKRGAPKRDWGPIARDDEAPDASSKPDSRAPRKR